MPMSVRLRLALLVCLAILLSAPAAGAYAPVNTPGPPLDVPQSALAAALSCSGPLAHATRDPVLLVPGTGSNPQDNFGWNYEPALTKLGIPWCAITLPQDANGDIQVNGEYVVYAIRTEFARAGRRVAIIGHSQGGMVPRWALRWWPDTRPMVADVIGFAPTNHGTTVAATACQTGCSPADMQQENTSNFIRALNSGQETFPGIAYTDVYTHRDEEVQPNNDDTGSSSLHGGGGLITNVAVQDICPADSSEHLLLGTIDPVAYALAVDALDHPGQPADPSHVAGSVCASPFMPGVDPVTGPAAGLKALVDDETSASQTVSTEPPLACYVTASCPSQLAVQGASATVAPGTPRCTARVRFLLHATRGRRVVAVRVLVGRRLVAHRRGHRLRSVTVPVSRTTARTLRIVSVWSDGSRHAVVRRLGACTGRTRRRR